MSKSLPVKYHTQRNNNLYPYATCNATSVATVMQWLGIKPPDYNITTQLDDHVTTQLESLDAWEVHKRTLPDCWSKYYPRNNHFVLKWYMEKDMPVHDRLIVSNVPDHFSEIRANIDKDMPVICGVFYKKKKNDGSISNIGHINVIVGYNDLNFIFCDPFGDASTLYQNPYGDHVQYSYTDCRERLKIAHILQKI